MRIRHGRQGGGVTTVDGANLIDTCLAFSHSGPVTLDSIDFRRGKIRGLTVSTTAADADLFVTNCGVHCCCRDSLWSGGGGTAFTGHAGSSVRFVGCEWGGMTERNWDYGNAGGCGVIGGYTRAYFANCSIVSNVCNAGGSGGAMGTAFHMNGQPFEMVGCRFAGNHMKCQGGVLMYLTGNCSGSVFRNCSFTGNQDNKTTGLVYQNTGAANTLEIDNCTFAYNLIAKCTAVRVDSGVATVRNSIFHGNRKDATSSVGADIHVGKNLRSRMSNQSPSPHARRHPSPCRRHCRAHSRPSGQSP